MEESMTTLSTFLAEVVPQVIQKASETKTNWEINAGDIMWPMAIMVAMLLLFLGMKAGFFGGARVEFGNKKFFLGGKNVGGDVNLHLAIDRLIEGKRKVENEIQSHQARTIRSTMEVFTANFPDDADPVAVLMLWARFSDELYLAAVENHILLHVDAAGCLKREYIEDKLVSIMQAHRLISRKYDLPTWGDVESKMFLALQSALERFHEIASSKWGAYKEQATSISDVLSKSDKEAAQRVDRILEGVWQKEREPS
jgi:hypothetical protein